MERLLNLPGGLYTVVAKTPWGLEWAIGTLGWWILDGADLSREEMELVGLLQERNAAASAPFAGRGPQWYLLAQPGPDGPGLMDFDRMTQMPNGNWKCDWCGAELQPANVFAHGCRVPRDANKKQ